MTNTFTKKLTTYEKNFICYKLTFNAIKNTTNSIEFMYKKDGYTITIYKNNTLLIQGVNADE
ncbi:hypothetical protein FACS189459_1150 [Bacilli bacterium]|nr:hypothetical protein FACS189459_1150 [Bacilli bacterium]